MSPECLGLPTALSNAADSPTPLSSAKQIPSCAPLCPGTTTRDVTRKEQTISCTSCANIKGELAIAKQRIAELEYEVIRLKNCPAAVDIPGFSGGMEGQEKVLSGLQWERLEPEDR